MFRRKKLTQETKPWREMSPQEKANAFDESHANPTEYARKNFTQRYRVAGAGESVFFERLKRS